MTWWYDDDDHDNDDRDDDDHGVEEDDLAKYEWLDGVQGRPVQRAIISHRVNWSAPYFAPSRPVSTNIRQIFSLNNTFPCKPDSYGIWNRPELMKAGKCAKM